jgi:hypothetical protein
MALGNARKWILYANVTSMSKGKLSMCTHYLCPNTAPWWKDSQNKGLRAFWECFPIVDLTHNKTQGDYDESDYR